MSNEIAKKNQFKKQCPRNKSPYPKKFYQNEQKNVTKTMKKCAWATRHPLEESYHDTEWGTPIRDDRLLFEFLILEGAQAGLSWTTIIKKRDNFRKAFDNFDVKKVAQYDQIKIATLLSDAGIIRNKLKINAAINNAKVFLQVQQEFGSFSDFIWGFVNHVPIQNRWQNKEDVPATTPLSDTISKQLKQRGFRFVGSTICYAFMQATGMVNDHTLDCFRHAQLAKTTPL